MKKAFFRAKYTSKACIYFISFLKLFIKKLILNSLYIN
jgi:hypothetical protein